jgi:uncharacterized GH25 family protein
LKAEQLSGGYAIWLEPVQLHFHHGDQVKVKVLWGLGMKSDDLSDCGQWKGTVVDPAGAQVPAQIVRNENGPGNLLVFNSGPEGIYTVQVENDAGLFYRAGDGSWSKVENNRSNERDGLRFKQWARLLVPVGHHVHGKGLPLNRGLEIIPEEFGDFHPGDFIGLSVLYEGQPLTGARVRATYHLYEGIGFPHTFTTNEYGQFEFKFDARGHWMFQADSRAGDMEHIATLVIPGVR